MIIREKTSNSIKSKYNFSDEYICNTKTGIVKDIFQWLPEPDDPRIYLMAAITSNSDRLNDQPANTFNSGAGLTLEQAYNSAVGEAIERYASSFIDRSKLILSKYKDLNVKAVEPEMFAFYHDKQYNKKDFPFSKFEKNTLINWVEGYSLTYNYNKLIPAAVTFLPYKNCKESGEELIWYPVSTGLSCASSIEEAVLKGIYEVIERDYFSILWFNNLEMPLIDLTSNSRVYEIYKKYFEIPNCKYHLIDMTMDVKIPTVLGILEDYSGGMMIAASTRLNLEDAVIKTMTELAQGRISWKRDFVEGVDDIFKDDYSDIRDFHSRVRLFAKNGMKKHIEFTFNSKERVSIDSKYKIHKDSIKNQLDIVVKNLKDKGYEVIIYDLTTPDVRARGYNVIRVVLPGFTEITNDHVIPRAGGNRIYEIPYKLGLTSRQSEFEKLNNIPHPFP